MGYTDKEKNRIYHRMYYEETKTKNPEAYESRKEKARMRYHLKKQTESEVIPKRTYTKRNLTV